MHVTADFMIKTPDENDRIVQRLSLCGRRKRNRLEWKKDSIFGTRRSTERPMDRDLVVLLTVTIICAVLAQEATAERRQVFIAADKVTSPSSGRVKMVLQRLSFGALAR